MTAPSLEAFPLLEVSFPCFRFSAMKQYHLYVSFYIREPSSSHAIK